MFEFSPIFWQMVWANFVWAISTLVIFSIPTILITRWKIKKSRAKQLEIQKDQKNKSRVICFEPPKAEKGHCPLCGQGWPLEGPLIPSKEEDPDGKKEGESKT